MKPSIVLLFSLIALLTESKTVCSQQSVSSDTSLERSLHAFAMTRSDIRFGEFGFRLFAVSMVPGESAVVVYWDNIGDMASSAKLGYFDRQHMIPIETDGIANLERAKATGMFPGALSRSEIKDNRHTFETREPSIPAEWRQLLSHLKGCLSESGVSSYEELESLRLIDLDLDGDIATPDQLSLLLKQRTDPESYILIRPGLGVARIEVVTATKPEAFVSKVLPAIRAVPMQPFSYVAVSAGAEVTWAAIDKNASETVYFHLIASRSERLASLSGGVVPHAVLFSKVEAKLTHLWEKGVIQSKVDVEDFCRWLTSGCGPTTHRPIDPAALLLE